MNEHRVVFVQDTTDEKSAALNPGTFAILDRSPGQQSTGPLYLSTTIKDTKKIEELPTCEVIFRDSLSGIKRYKINSSKEVLTMLLGANYPGIKIPE